MKTCTWPLALLLTAALSACTSEESNKNATDRRDNDGNTDTQNGAGTNDYADRESQGTRSTGTTEGQVQMNTGEDRTTNGRSGGSEEATVSLSCLRNMDAGDWRELGLNSDQLTRVQRLQRNMGTNGGNTGAEGGSTRDGATGGGDNAGTTNPGNDQGSMSAPRANNLDGIALDRGTQSELDKILTGEQLQELGRMCSKGEISASAR